MSHLRTHRPRQTKPHRAEPGGTQPAEWFIKIPELRCPHLVLPHTDRHDRIFIRQFSQLGDQVLWNNIIFVQIVFERKFLFPFSNLLEPRANVLFWFHPFTHHFKRPLHITLNRNIDRYIFIDLGRVDVHVDEFGSLAKFR